MRHFKVTNSDSGIQEDMMKQEDTEDTKQSQNSDGNKWANYLKNLGIAGFLFFLVKGLAWIAVFVLGAKGCSSLAG